MISKILQDDRGDISVKGIAIAVASIVVIGAVVVFLTGGFLTDSIQELWSSLGGWLEAQIGIGW